VSPASATTRINGLGVCAGIGFGRVHIVDRRRLTAPHYHIPIDGRPKELERFERAITASEQQLSEFRVRAKEAGLPQVEMLLAAHAMILRDSAFHDASQRAIEKDGQNAEWALKETVRALKAAFDRLDQDYFRERRSDVDIVGDRVLRNLVGAETDVLEHLSEDAVVVAYDLSPADMVALAKYAARGFVTESGGRTSHTAILARALGVPSVVSASRIVQLAGSGDEIIVDGGTGEILLRPSASMASKYRGRARRLRLEQKALLADRLLPAETSDGCRIELLGNIEVSQEVESVLLYGGEGIGLYRTEFLPIERPGTSGAAAHYEAYQRVVEAVGARPLTIRTLDLGGDKNLAFPSSVPISTVPSRSHAPVNPALGLRAIRLSLKDEPLFREQLEGILLASATGKVRLLLPFITGVEELRRTKEIIADVQKKLDGEGKAYASSLPVGVMIETPAAAWIADLLAKEADFFAVGTNDLIQYVLATDRQNEEVAYLYRPCHPALLKLLDSVAKAARSERRPVSICGEMAADPFHAPLLLGLGFRSLSMTARSIPLVKRMIRKLSLAECETFAQSVLTLATASDVEQALTENLRRWAPDLFGVD
jgi:phosphoenolpyruvate-protein phosphotransferase (PTS system enzyme I)